MRRKILILAITISIFIGFTGCMGVAHLGHSTVNTDTDQQYQDNQETVQNYSDVYTCPMHPEVISEQPGYCPKCGMELVLQSSITNSNGSMKMGCMNMSEPNKPKSHVGMYMGGGVVMVGMMALMVLRFL